MKKLFITTLILAFPLFTYAAFVVPWNATSTSQKWVFPKAPNGVNYTVVGNNFIATSTTATSTFNGTTQLATTTSSSINDVITVDGIHYAKTGSGIQQALNDCALYTCGTVFIPKGVYSITNPISISASTTVMGAGQDATILRINPASIGNFSFSYILKPSGTAQNVVIKNLTVDGNFTNLVAPAASTGGLILPGDYWTVDHVTFNSSNYFMIFPNNTNHVVISNSIFEGNGSGSDCIGGGGNIHMLVENNLFLNGITCNVFDNVRGSYVTIRNNRIEATSTTIFLEGMTDTTVENNQIVSTAGSGIQAKSEYGYSDKLYITNPLNIKILNNSITGYGYIGFKYADEFGHAAATYSYKGGGNIISGNFIKNARDSGILFHMSTSSQDKGGNVISNNTIVDANQAGDVTWNVGDGIVHPSAINVAQGSGFTITGNAIFSSSTLPTQRYGIELGQTFLPTANNEPNNVVSTGNICTDSDTVLGCFNNVSPTYTTKFITSDVTNGFNISGTCFAVNGTCISGSQWVTSGSNIYYTTGAVGIGTTSPDYKLTVQDVGGGGAQNLLHIGDYSTNSSGSRLLIDNRWTGNAVGGESLVIRQSPTIYRFTVTGAGNVGIGTSTPGATLSIGNTGANTILLYETATSTFGSGINVKTGCFSVNGACVGGSNLTAPVSVSNGGTGQTSFAQGWLNISDAGAFQSSTSPTVAYLTATSTTATSTFNTGGLAVGGSGLVVQQNSGNVGIGTSTPDYKTTIQQTSGGVQNLLHIGDTSTNASGNRLLIEDRWTGNTLGDESLAIRQSPTIYRLVVTGGGLVGIGTSSPNWLLQEVGTQPSFALSDSSAVLNRKHWLLTSNEGILYLGTTTDVYATSTPSALTILNNGNTGISTSSPGSILSVGGVANFTSGTSTFASSGGINITGGCFSVSGVCLSTSSGGTVTSVTGSFPIFSSGGATPNITFGGLSTSSAAVVGNIPYFSGVNTFANVATSSETCSSPLSCTAHAVLTGGGAISIANAVADGSTKGAASFTAADFNDSSGNISLDYTNGQAASAALKGFLNTADWNTFNGKIGTSSTLTAGQLLSVTDTGIPPLVTSVATGTITCSGTVSCGAGSYVVGSNLTITGSASSGTTVVSTSSVPTIGNLAYWTGNGTPSTLGTVATTSIICSGFITCTGFNALGAASTITTTGQLSVANGGTGQSAFAQGWLNISDAGAFQSSTSPTVAYITATSSAATSTFYGGIAGPNTFTVQSSSGNVRIGGGTNATNANLKLYVDSNANVSTDAGVEIRQNGGNANALFVHSGDNIQNTIVAQFTNNNTTDVGPTLGITNKGKGNILNLTNNIGQVGAFLNSGFLGIGTTTPFTSLDVASTSAAASMKGQLALTDNGAGANLKHWLLSSNQGVLYVGTTTDVYATSTPSAFYIQNNGSAYFPAAASSGSNQTGYWCYDANGQLIRDTTTCLISASKFKKNITPIDVGLSEILKLQPVNYYLKDDMGDANNKVEQFGFVADEVAKIDSRLVTYDNKGEIHGFRYEQFTAILTKAIQDIWQSLQSLVARVSGLEQKLNAQQKQIDDLEQRLNALEHK